MFKKITLKNNLRVLLIPVKDSKSVTLSFYIKAGSRFENEKNSGVAHFLEHMVFRGTKKYPTQLDLSKFVEGLGADWNASTSNESIQCYIRAEASSLPSLAEILNEMLFNSLYKEDDIEKERGVIIEEINMYEDVPEHKVAMLIDELMWPEHPLGRNIAGSKSTVSSFTKEDLVSYKSKFFSANNMVVGVSGNFEEEKVISLLEDTYGNIPDFEVPTYEKVKDLQTEPQVLINSRKSEQTHMCFGFKTFGRNDSRRFALTLISMLLGGGISSRLYQNIVAELGLAYYINAFAQFYMDVGAFHISAGINTNSYRLAISEIIKELKKFIHDVDASEVERVKSHYKGVLAVSLEDHKRLNRFLSDQELLTKKILDYEGVMKEINEVTKDDIVDISEEIFISNKLNLAIVGEVSESEVKKLAHF